MILKFLKPTRSKLTFILITFLSVYALIFLCVLLTSQCWFTNLLPSHDVFTVCDNSVAFIQTSLASFNLLILGLVMITYPLITLPLGSVIDSLSAFVGNTFFLIAINVVAILLLYLELSLLFWLGNKLLFRFIKNKKIFLLPLLILVLLIVVSIFFSLIKSNVKPDYVKIRMHTYPTIFNGGSAKISEFDYADLHTVNSLNYTLTTLPMKDQNNILSSFFGLTITCLGGALWGNAPDYELNFYQRGELIRSAKVGNNCKGGTSLSLVDSRETSAYLQNYIDWLTHTSSNGSNL